MAVIKFPGFGRGQSYEYQGDDGYFDEEDDRDYIDDGDEALNSMTAEEAEAYHRARRQTILRIARYVAIGAVIFCGLGLLIYNTAQNGTYSRATYTQIAEVSSGNATQYLMLGGKIVSYSRDGVSCMSTDGTQVYNITYEMQQPLTSQAGDVLAIADKGGSQILILSPTRQLGTANTSLPIQQITVAENGEVAAIVEDQDTTWIYLYTSDGETIAYFKTTMSQSGYPMNVAISPDGTLVGVSHLVASSDGVDTSIAFYNFGGVGANSVENNVSGFNYNNEVFPYIRFMNDDTCVAVSDSRAAFYTGSEIPQSGANILWSGQALGVWSNDRYLAVLFTDTTGEGEYNMKVYNTSGDVVGDFVFTMDYSSIQLAGDRIYMNNARECQIYTVTGIQKFDSTFDTDIQALIPSATSHTRHAIVTETGIDTMILE